jgi:hypothetical protein
VRRFRIILKRSTPDMEGDGSGGRIDALWPEPKSFFSVTAG